MNQALINKAPCSKCASLAEQSADIDPHSGLTSGPTAAIWGGQDYESVGRWWKCTACEAVLLRNIDSRIGERLWHFADARFNPFSKPKN